MKKSKVAIVAYEKPLRSVRKAVALSNGMDRLPAKAKVFIKPNIVKKRGRRHERGSLNNPPVTSGNQA